MPEKLSTEKQSAGERTVMLRVVISGTPMRLLKELATYGIYGDSATEVARRFIDEALQKFTDRPLLSKAVRP